MAGHAHRRGNTIHILLALMLSAGLIGCPTTGPGSPDAGSDAGSDAGGDSQCDLVAIGEISLFGLFDIGATYSAPLATPIGSDVADLMVFDFVNYNERFGSLAIGTFPLATAPNDNRGTCPECILVLEDTATLESPGATIFFQSKGSITLETDPRTGHFRGQIVSLELVEVTLDPFTLESTPVPDGRCLRVDDLNIDFKFVPPEWTCDPALYQSGGACNCTCGAPDPDCTCDPFMNPNCPPTIENDCEPDELCTFQGCKQKCDPFSNPPIPCADASALCAFDHQGPVCIDATDRVNSAGLGELCQGLGIYVEYCAVNGTLPGGICDDDTGVCRPACGLDGCPAGQSCFTIAGGGTDDGWGYCVDG